MKEKGQNSIKKRLRDWWIVFSASHPTIQPFKQSLNPSYFTPVERETCLRPD